MTQFLISWIVAPLVIFAAGLGIGYKLTSDHYAAQQVKAITRVVYVVQKQGAVNTQVAATVQAQHDRIVYKTITLTKEIPYAVPAASDFVLTRGWVRLHDAAASDMPALADSAEPTDVTDSAFKASDALATVIANYGTANDCLAQLSGWRSWYTQQQAAFAAR